MTKLLGVLLVVPILMWGIMRFVKSQQFEINCGGHLERAASANSVELADTELKSALQYMEENHLTQGNTGCLWSVPSNDVGFWYNNIKSAQTELSTLPANATPLEKTNVLIKLRESIMHHSDNSDKLNCPDGISVFPSNMLYAVFFWIGIILCFVGIVVVKADLD